MIRKGLAALLATLVLIAPAKAQDASDTEQEKFSIHATLLSEVFVPEKFFQEDMLTEPLLTITYTGDDWNWPVYALALFKGCHAGDAGDYSSCGDRYTVRMVRGPWDESDGELERPRWRGSALLSNLKDRGVSDRDELFQALDEGAVEWLESDLEQCPAAMKFAETSPDLAWFAQPLIPEPDDEIRIVIHYDTVHVRYTPIYSQRMEYTGEVDQRLPSGWAVQFYDALEDCWSLTQAPPPWRQTPLDDLDDE